MSYAASTPASFGRRPGRARALLAVAMLATTLIATSAWGQTAEEGDARVRRAQAACLGGDLQTGVRLLAELYAETQDPLWIFNQARCYQQNNAADLATSRFREFLRKTPDKSSELARQAEEHVRELERAARMSPPPTAQGSLETRAPTRETGPATRHGGQRTAALVVAGVGAAAVATGLTFTLLVRKTQADVEDRAKGAVILQGGAVDDDFKRGARYETLQWVCYGVGVAALAAGAALYHFGGSEPEPQASSAPRLVPFIAGDAGGALLHVGF
jgi:hypothetical protein